MSRRTINNYVERLEKEKKTGRTILIDGSNNNMSSITDPNSYSGLNSAEKDAIDADSNSDSSDSNDDADSNSGSNADHTFDANSNSDSDAKNEPPKVVGGRPKGSTIATSIDLKERTLAAMNDAAIELRKRRENA
jgi:hypothetical protein